MLSLLSFSVGVFPNFVTGISTCPFFSFKRYQLDNNQHYSYDISTGSIGRRLTGAAYPFPTDAPCSTAQPPKQLPCPAMVRALLIRLCLQAESIFRDECQQDCLPRFSRQCVPFSSPLLLLPPNTVVL